MEYTIFKEIKNLENQDTTNKLERNIPTILMHTNQYQCLKIIPTKIVGRTQKKTFSIVSFLHCSD